MASGFLLVGVGESGRIHREAGNGFWDSCYLIPQHPRAFEAEVEFVYLFVFAVELRFGE